MVAGVSPTQDSLWTVNRFDNAIVKRLHPTIPVETINGFNSLATDPTTGDHYCLMVLDGVPGVVLGTINIQTGICTQIGTGMPDVFKTIAFNANGSLFGITGEVTGTLAPETMYRIDKTSGAVDITPFRGLTPAGDDEVLAYNNDDHYFYRWSGTAPNTWERFDTTGLDVAETLTFTPTPASEVVGALYEGGGEFVTSNAMGEWMMWDALGNIGSSIITFDGPVRGMVTETHMSSISSSGPVAICPGSSVDLTVTGGTGGYQWYKDGMLMSETSATLNVTDPGVYNCVYADVNGVVDSPATGIHVTHLEAPSISVSPLVSICHGITTAMLTYNTSTGFGFSPTPYTYTVPAGVTSVEFELNGGSGGVDTSTMSIHAPGFGGRTTGTLNVTPGDVLTINIGSAGQNGMMGGVPGGMNGGGASAGFGGSGGGASDIRLGGTALSDRVAVAGGGGGCGYDTALHMSVGGGHGGNFTGADGGMNSDITATPATGGDQTAGGIGATYTGALPGGDGSEGFGGAGSIEGISGGGGAGYYGGGGGAFSGGGGGSSFTDPMHVPASAYLQGANMGDGSGNVSYIVPATYTYSINWSGTAITAGFTDVTAATFPTTGSAFPITVPTTADPDTYTGTLVIDNGICTSTHPINVEVKPIPTVNATPDQTPVCNGIATTDVNFSGPLPFTQFNWTNDLNTIGLGDDGTGDILSFTGVNIGTDIDTANIIVTPELNGCFGTPDTFTYVVFPTPVLTNNTGNVCDNEVFNYTATSPTAGTTFVWERTTLPTGLAGAATASGTNTISETFDNTTDDVINVAYTFTLTANGCDNVEVLNVNANPTPRYTLTPLTGSICDGDLFTFVQNSPTPGVTYSWGRPAIAGITPATGSGTGSISEVLNNTTTDPILVTYVDTLRINGCSNLQTVQVSVNPTPTLSSSLTPPSVCNNEVFDYNATTATAGTTITWDRAVIPGISSPAASGPDTVNETHTNTTDNPIDVVYTFTLDANGCSNTQDVTVVVNPTPFLNTSLTPAAICDSSIFDYDPASNTVGATFAWSRAAVANISNPAATGTGNPNERLRNTATFPVAVTYVFTTTIDGCSNAENVSVTVNPRPVLTNTPLTSTICDSSSFVFVPTSATLGTYFHWSRPFVPGIAALPDTGSGAVNHQLVNTTNTNVDVPYTFTLSANGCSRTQDVRVTVRPTPKMSSTLTDSACSGMPYVYTPTTNLIPPVTYAWNRPSVLNISPATASGTNGINETLINSTTGNIDVVYVYTVTVGGTCSKRYDLRVKVRPAAAAPSITTKPASSSLCGSSLFVNFGAPNPPAFGNTYIWSATNAEVYAVGADKQYSLVHFKSAGTATVTLTSSIGATGCQGVATYTVNVGTDSIATPKVIYTNGAFICLLNDVDGFQWGSDDSTTLDSTMYAGETSQSYFNSTPNWTRHYWVMVKKGDCIKKAYYNAPGDNTPRYGGNAGEGATIMRVFPNPANDNVSVEVTTEMEGTMNVELTNMLGQVINKVDADTRKVSMNIASLPAGVYMIDCYLGGVKVGAAKFVKN
ncbi:hypothetical protein GCM10023093_14760 [Nemorincola caseinilytica]|uniref:receptor protein-tyrosine kinase n=1 Tax=Nemorincola caseinilytica TaxID=2054315 RepID=A0ABP8NEC4_9BACT